MSLVERTGDQNISVVRRFSRSIHRLLELTPVYSRRRDREFTSKVKSTISKLLTDVQNFGFAEFYGGDGPGKSYYVVLKGAQGQRYWVDVDYSLRTLDVEYGRNLAIRAFDDNYDGSISPIRRFVLDFSGRRDRPFFSPDWTGVSYFGIGIRRVPPGQKDLTPQEMFDFLDELLNASVDEEETRKRFRDSQQESVKEKPGWTVQWARDEEQCLLLG